MLKNANPCNTYMKISIQKKSKTLKSFTSFKIQGVRSAAVLSSTGRIVQIADILVQVFAVALR